VFCPRCGAPTEKVARFCAACGATLPGGEPEEGKESERRSFGDRLRSLAGTTRQARIVTAVTLTAIAVAVVAFLALDSDSGQQDIPRDAYTLAADKICVGAQKDIASSERRSLASEGAGPGAFAQALVPVVIRWRSEMGALEAPPDRIEQIDALDTALRSVEIEIAALARVAQEGDRQETVARAKQVDEVTSEVEEAVANLGLTRCAHLTLGLAPAASG
jgi:hypothetical protein